MDNISLLTILTLTITNDASVAYTLFWLGRRQAMTVPVVVEWMDKIYPLDQMEVSKEEGVLFSSIVLSLCTKACIMEAHRPPWGTPHNTTSVQRIEAPKVQILSGY